MIAKPYTYDINLKAITYTKGVLEELIILSKQLMATELEDLLSFNNAYIVVTKQINLALGKDVFEQPKLVAKLEIIFAKYYFSALNQYAKTKSLPLVWQTVLTPSSGKPNPAYLSLLLGANAHICHDLPLALVDIVKDQDEFHNDYRALNQVLVSSAASIINTLNESNHTLSFVEHNLSFVYRRFIMNKILRWRARAWLNFVGIKEASTSESDISIQTLKNADKLARWRGL